MRAKETVRQQFPQAFHQRFRTHGGRGYTLIWSDHQRIKRLSEGSTTAQAWANAAAIIRLAQGASIG